MAHFILSFEIMFYIYHHHYYLLILYVHLFIFSFIQHTPLFKTNIKTFNLQTSAASQWTESNVISGSIINDGNTLLTFAQWINANRNTGALPEHDHAALFTA